MSTSTGGGVISVSVGVAVLNVSRHEETEIIGVQVGSSEALEETSLVRSPEAMYGWSKPGIRVLYDDCVADVVGWGWSRIA